ncbi:hypothetical protein Patl1_11005 [Pistacia atlantica]|uniref:Uncharacterized protein n=1 Tax=Pistacia atlantica TaxID=434234 RepID=A0ACC1A454_9ROSI|nr:hypothetical protein Patl1_11005 [Pistacia atlantica]
MYPSCYVWYDKYQFYNETLTAAPAPTPVILSPPPPGSATGPQGSGDSSTGYRLQLKSCSLVLTERKIRISSSIIIAIVVPTAVAVVALFISGYCVLSRKAKKKYNDNGRSNDRPTMAMIVLTLNSYAYSSTPQKPAFFLGSRGEASMPTKELDFDQPKSISMPWSVDDASIIKYILDNRVLLC